MINCIAIFFTAIFSISDLALRRIPNLLTVTMAAVSICIHILLRGLEGLVFSILGLGLGLLLLLIPFLFGGMGGGDVKAIAALGALIGPSAIFQTFLYTALFGGAISLVYYVVVYDVREKTRAGLAAVGAFAVSRDVRCLIPEAPKKKHKIPYAPAMLLGYLAYLAWGNLV